MNDVETRLCQCLARNAVEMPVRADLLDRVRRRSRQLRRRRTVLAAAATVPALTVGSATALAVSAHGPSSSHVSVAPASETSSPAAGSAYGDHYCPQGQRADLFVDDSHPVASAGSGSPEDELAKRYGGAVVILGRDNGLFFVNGHEAPSTSSWFLVITNSGQMAGSYVVDRGADGSWRAWAATVAGCRSVS